MQRISSTFALVSLACAVSPLWAQQQLAAAGDADQLQPVVVTATRHAEDVQHVPMAVAALTSSALRNLNVTTTQDLQVAVPALVYSNLGGYGIPYLRGVGTDFTQPNADSSVATYVDDVYVASDQAIITNLLGVERVEVVEGPQGTLFGRNATGGAIRIITLTPTSTPSAELSVSGGNYDSREVSGHLSGAVTDNLNVGVYVGGIWNNPYVKDLSPAVNPTTVNEDGSWGARVKAVWTPTDKLNFTLSAEDTSSAQFEPYAWRNIAQSYLGQLFGGQSACCNYTTISAGLPVHALNRMAMISLHEELNLDWAQLVGISGYIHSTADDSDNTGSVGIPLLQDFAHRIFSNQFSQELRLVSPEGQDWKWVTGLYYFYEDAGFKDLLEGSNYFALAPGAGAEDQNSDAVTNSYAAYAQTDIPLNVVLNGLRLTLGARYSIDQKRHYGTDTWYATGALVSCGSAVDLNPDCATVITPPWNPGGPAATTPFPNNQDTWHNFTPKITISQQLNPDNLVYLTYSEGYKSGVYNLPSGSTPGPVNPEHLKAVEIGSKSTLLDRRLQANLDAYYYWWSNMQVEIVTPLLQTLLTNAAQARAYGFESSLKALLGHGFEGNLGLSLEHSTYSKFGSPGCSDPGNECFSGVDFLEPVSPGSSIDATGNELPHAPKYVITLGLSYDHDLPKGSVHANIDWYRNGGFFWSAQNGLEGGFRQPAYGLVNASAGYTFPNGQWTVTAWGTNLTNTFSNMATVSVASFGELAVPAPPRMWGVRVSYQLN